MKSKREGEMTKDVGCLFLSWRLWGWGMQRSELFREKQLGEVVMGTEIQILREKDEKEELAEKMNTVEYEIK